MCTWFNNANPNVKGSYKFLHHVVGGYKTTWSGVCNSMAKLMQPSNQTPKADRKECYDHLANHYKEFGKESPEFKDYTYEEWKEIFSFYVGIPEILDSLVNINL